MKKKKQSIVDLVLSSVGKKYLMSITGLGLVIFTIAHLSGNLLLLVPDEGTLFNTYAKGLHDLGILLIVAEVGLVIAFLVHLVIAVQTKLNVHDAREEAYHAPQSTKGGNSKFGFASKNMILAGAVLGAFVVFHLIHFKFGPSIEEGYVTFVKGERARDLYQLVIQEFKKPWVVLVYVASMVMLGIHVKHGFWSAFQSLGLAFPKISKPIYGLGLFIAFALAAGFIAIPLIIFFGDFI